MGVHATVVRPLLALLVIAVAAMLLSIPARAGGGDPIAQMEEVVQHMENAMGHVIEELGWKLEEAETPQEQWAAYIDCVNEVEYYRDYKAGAIADIAGGDPELQEAVEYYQSIINALADETLQELAWMYENAEPPESTTTTSVPQSTTTTSSPGSTTTSTTVSQSSTTTHPATTTTTRPRNTTTTKPPRNETTTTSTASPPPPNPPASTSTTTPAAPASSTTTTTTLVAPSTSEAAAPPPPTSTTTTTVPSLFDNGSGAVAFSQINESLGGDEIETIDAQARAEAASQSTNEASASVLDLAAMTAFQAQEGLMDGTLLMVDYVGSTLPAPVAAPVISLVAIVEMIARALLAGTQAFIGPSLVFGIYVAYRSLITFVAHRRAGIAV